MRRAWFAVLGLLVAWVPNAVAYHGGPDVFELLGWSASEQRVYWLMHGYNESGEGPAVYYAELGRGKSRTATQLEWSRGDLDSAAVRRIRAMRRRLVPLVDEPGPRLPEGTPRVVTDTVVRDAVVTDTADSVPRHRVSGTFHSSGYRFDVVTYCRPDVFLLHEYLIPGHDERLVVIGFIGIQDRGNSCEETQEAVVVKRGGEIPLLEYKRRW